MLSVSELRGRVVNVSGDPIEGAVIAWRDAPSDICQETARTGTDGAFAIDRPPGFERITVTSPAYFPLSQRIPVRDSSPVELTLEGVSHLTLGITGPSSAGSEAGFVRVRAVREVHEFGNQSGFELDHGREPIETVADDSNVAVLSPLVAGASYRISAYHSAFAATSITLAPGIGAQSTTLAMRRGGGVSAVLVDEEGAGAIGVWCVPRSDDALDLDLWEKLKPQGSQLALGQLPPGTYTFEVGAADRQPVMVRGVAVLAGKVASLGKLELPPSVSVSGVLRSKGTPVPSAKITIAHFNAGRLTEDQCLSSEGGRFRQGGFSPREQVRLAVEAEGFVSLEMDATAPAELDIEMTKTGRVRVQLVDEASLEAIVDARIWLKPEGREYWGEERPAEFDDEGVTTLSNVPAGVYVLKAAADGFVATGSESFEVDPALEPTSVRIELSRGGVLEGQVSAVGSGDAVADANVIVRTLMGLKEAVSTDWDGRFFVDGVAGDLDVTITHPAYIRQKLQGLASADYEQPLAIELETGCTLSGTVLVDGRSGASARVECSGQTSMTDGDGRYSLAGLPCGRVLVRMRPYSYGLDGLEERHTELTRGEEGRLDFGVGARLEGLVTVSGQPAAQASVMLMPRGQQVWHSAPLRATQTREDGSFVLEGVEPGEFVLTVGWQGRATSLAWSVPKEYRTEAREIILDLATVGGSVRSASGAPIPFAPVHATLVSDSNCGILYKAAGGGTALQAMPAASCVSATSSAAADGTYLLHLGEPGRYSIIARVPDYEAIPPEPPVLDVPLGGRLEADLILERLVELVVEVRDSTSGRLLPESGAAVIPNITLVGGTGRFSFERQAAGSVLSVVAGAVGYAPQFRTDFVVPEAAQPSVVRLDAGGGLMIAAPVGSFELTPHTIKNFSLFDANGRDLVQAAGWAFRMNSKLDSDGTLTITHVATGSYTVGVDLTGDGASDLTAGVTVRTGRLELVSLE